MASRTSPRRVALVALLALVAVVAVVGAVALFHGPDRDRRPVAGRTTTRPTTRPPATAAPAGVVAGTNRALAVAEAGRISLSLPLPPGARAVPAFPSRLLGRLVDAGVASDPTLRQVGRWVVPLTKVAMQRWYARHLPSSVSHDYDPSAPPATRGYFSWRVTENSPAFTDPEVLLAFVGWGRHRTALRTDVSLAAYSDRTAETLVPPTVTRIDVRARAIDGPPPLPHKRGSTTDPAVVGRIASSFDAMSGAPEGAGPSPCGSLVGPPGQRAYVYTVTFHWPGHELVVDPGQPTCGVGMGLTLDGRRLPQVLAGTEEFDSSLEAALRRT